MASTARALSKACDALAGALGAERVTFPEAITRRSSLEPRSTSSWSSSGLALPESYQPVEIAKVVDKRFVGEATVASLLHSAVKVSAEEGGLPGSIRRCDSSPGPLKAMAGPIGQGWQPP